MSTSGQYDWPISDLNCTQRVKRILVVLALLKNDFKQLVAGFGYWQPKYRQSMYIRICVQMGFSVSVRHPKLQCAVRQLFAEDIRYSDERGSGVCQFLPNTKSGN